MKLHVSSATIPVLALALMIFPELAPQSDSVEFTTNGGRRTCRRRNDFEDRTRELIAEKSVSD